MRGNCIPNHPVCLAAGFLAAVGSPKKKFRTQSAIPVQPGAGSLRGFREICGIRV